jgi:adenylylsulfate kinase
VLDGDVLREGISCDLGYSLEDRFEHVRRTAYLALSIAQYDVIVLVAAITPLEAMRRWVRANVPYLLEVFIDAPLEECEKRDPKGLYKRARAGTIAEFTGVDSPFEIPSETSLTCCTDQETIEESCSKVCQLIVQSIGL